VHDVYDQLHVGYGYCAKLAYIHLSVEERKLSDLECPLLVQLNWGKDDREGRFLLKRESEKTTAVSFHVLLFCNMHLMLEILQCIMRISIHRMRSGITSWVDHHLTKIQAIQYFVLHYKTTSVKMSWSTDHFHKNRPASI